MHTPLRHVRSSFSRKKPIHLTLFVTSRCNARCPFCFYEKARDEKSAVPELSLDEIRRVASSMGDLLWVLFSGGEIFLRDDLPDIAQVFHDANRAAFLTLPTNGLLPETIAARTEQILERCPASVVVVKLSLDGVGERHDAVREVPGGFEKLMRTYALLANLARKHANLELGVNTLFCSANQWQMDEIAAFVRTLGAVRSHTVTMVRGNLMRPHYKDVDLDEYLRAGRQLRSRHRFRGAGVKAAIDRLQRRLIHRTLQQERRVVACQAGRLNLVLTERGQLHPCEERWDLSFGNVRDAGYDVAKMLRTAQADRILREIAAGACHCSHECNFLTNILFNPAALLTNAARELRRSA
ncbi:MAG: radical SAM protein [Deltaproteobacteria bacterium]